VESVLNIGCRKQEEPRRGKEYLLVLSAGLKELNPSNKIHVHLFVFSSFEKQCQNYSVKYTNGFVYNG